RWFSEQRLRHRTLPRRRIKPPPLRRPPRSITRKARRAPRRAPHRAQSPHLLPLRPSPHLLPLSKYSCQRFGRLATPAKLLSGNEPRAASLPISGRREFLLFAKA